MVEAGILEVILSWTTIPFFIIGFIGNVMVIRIVHKTRDMHTPTNCLLANMAVSDVLSILLASISLVMFFLGFGKVGCKLTIFIEISTTVSSITLTVLAVERYHALLKPFRTGLRLKEDNIAKAIAFIWIASVIMCFPGFIFAKWSETHSACVGPWTLRMKQKAKVYVIVNASLTSMLMLVMFYCHGSLIRGLYFTKTVCPKTAGERSSEKKKLVVTFILASIGFFIAYAPLVVFYIVVASKDDEEINVNLYNVISTVVGFVFAGSSCFNPILYAFRSRNFQEGFKRMLCREGTGQNEIQLR